MVPDYYARLGVDPRAERAEIEAALQRKQPAWSMGTRNPKTRHANQLYLDEIPALRKQLAERSGLPRRVRRRVGRGPDARAGSKLDELQRRVRLRAAKGGLLASDRGLLGRRGGQARPESRTTCSGSPADPEPGRDAERERRRRARRRPARRRARPVDPSTDPRGTRAPGLPRPVRCARRGRERPRRLHRRPAPMPNASAG